jgi:hypothetical protein
VFVTQQKNLNVLIGPHGVAVAVELEAEPVPAQQAHPVQQQILKLVGTAPQAWIATVLAVLNL